MNVHIHAALSLHTQRDSFQIQAHDQSIMGS